MPTETEIRGAIREVYAMQENAFQHRHTPRFNIAYGQFAGFATLANHLSLVMLPNGGAQLRAGDKRLTGKPGGFQTWEFKTRPTPAEAYAVLGEYFDAVNESLEQEQATRLQELREFHARHGGEWVGDLATGRRVSIAGA